MTPPKQHSISTPLIAWYRKSSARNLPWRKTRNPFAVWVSEIMLQQTRVEAVIPYYRKFLLAFPDAAALARAPLGKVLRAWEGLGYYSRARNLHLAARRIAKERHGRMPRSMAEWESLPGIGHYTAAAIAAIASGEDTQPLDGNVRRILARVFRFRKTVTGKKPEAALATLYLRMKGRAKPDEFFQALMDLGQLVCLPRKPRCRLCPISGTCLAYAARLQDSLPRRAEKKPVPHYDVAAAVIERDDCVLLAKRPKEKLLGGMWEFPGGKREAGESLEACLRRELAEELAIRVRVGVKCMEVPHAFTHFRITLHVFRCRVLRGEPAPIQVAEVRWVRVSDLGKYPMGKADRVVATALRLGKGTRSR